MHILYGGFNLNMSILVIYMNHRGQKDLPLKVRHKAYSLPLAFMPIISCI